MGRAAPGQLQPVHPVVRLHLPTLDPEGDMRYWNMHMFALACYLIGSIFYVLGTIVLMYEQVKSK